MLKRKVLMVFAAMAVAPSVVAAEADKFRDLIEEVYQHYSWVPVFSVQAPSASVPLKEEPTIVLSKYFSSDLAAAIKADSDCAHKTAEVCSLDFDILFDSQDPEARDLSIQSAGLNSVDVCYADQASHKRCFVFSGSDENGNVKIRDIIYDNSGRTLRGILNLKN